jgi:hypothetical protein
MWMTRGWLDWHSGLPTSRDRGPSNEGDSFHFYISIEDSSCHLQILHEDSNLQSQCVGNVDLWMMRDWTFSGQNDRSILGERGIKVWIFPDIGFVDSSLHAISVNDMRCPLCWYRNEMNPPRFTDRDLAMSAIPNVNPIILSSFTWYSQFTFITCAKYIMIHSLCTER